MLKNDIKPKYIYMMIKYWFGILDKTRKFHNIDISKLTLLENSVSSLETSTRDKTLEFTVIFSYKKWINSLSSEEVYFHKKQGSRNCCTL